MFSKSAFFFILLVFCAGCATLPPSVSQAPLQKTLQGFCSSYNMDCRWDGISQTVDMTYAGKRIRVMVGSKMILVDGERLFLGEALRRQNGMIIIPESFEQAVLGPSRRPQDDDQKVVRAGRIKKIMIDAGHGGKDPGAVGHMGLQEKDIVLDIALKTARLFESAGVQTVLTRRGDEFVSLQERTERASQEGIDFFVSIHANADKTRKASGVEVYYPVFLDFEDRFADQRRNNERRLFHALNMEHENPALRRVVGDLLYVHKADVSPGMAEAVFRTLSRETGAKVRGSKPQRFYVLKNTLIPSILVEVGFITHPGEARLLGDEGYRQRIAEAITKSVVRYVYDQGM